MTVADSSYTRACSSDPARTEAIRHDGPPAFSRELARARLSRRLPAPPAASRGRYPVGEMTEESRTPFRDIRISFIHTNFGTNLDLRERPTRARASKCASLSRTRTNSLHFYAGTAIGARSAERIKAGNQGVACL